ncbi:hypothetical protein EMCRGX_G027670 [Ephydatia muelleri]
MEGESEKQKPSAMVAQFQKNWELHVPQTHILGRSILNMLKTPLAEGVEIDNRNGAANGRPQSSIFFQSAKKRVTNGADQGKLLLDVQELEDACKASMEAVLHMEGAEHIREEMKAYTNEVFERLDKTREPLWQAAKQKLEQRQDLRLSCTVVSAQGIPAMDANGKSDPYCSLGVLPRRHQESQVQKGGNLEDWKEKLLGQVKKTSVKMATLEPEWNETLEFPLIDPMEEVLVIEVWDSDETAVGVTKVKGLKGIGNFLHDLRKGDDFIGRAFYSLSGLPIQPERRTLPIFSQSKKQQQQGSITVILSLKGREEVASPSDRLHNHKLLLKNLIAHESQQAAKRAGSDGYMTPWDAQLSSSAESLLALHARLGDIEDYQQAAIRVSALMDYHKAYCLTPQALLTLIHLIETHSILLPKAEAKSYSQDGGGSPTNVRKQSSASRSSGEQKWSAKAFHDLRNALTDAIEVLHNHLSLLDDSSEGVLEQIREALVLNALDWGQEQWVWGALAKPCAEALVVKSSGLSPVVESSGLRPVVKSSGLRPVVKSSGLSPVVEGSGLSPVGKSSGLRPVVEASSGLRPVVEGSGLSPVVKSSGLSPVVESSGLSPVVKSSGLRPVVKSSGLRPVVESSGLSPVVESSGLSPVVESSGLSPVVKSSGLRPVVEGSGLSPVGKSSGLSPVVESSGLSPVVESSGLRPVVESSGLSPVVKSSGLRPVVESSGLRPVVKSSGLSPVVESSGLRPVVESSGLSPVVKSSGLSPVVESSGLRPVVKSSGLSPVVESSGLRPVVKSSGLRPVVKSSGLSPVVKSSGLRPVVKSSGLSPVVKSSGLSPVVKSSGLSPVVKSSGLRPVVEGSWLEHCVCLVKRLYQFEEFVARLPADHKPVKTVVEKAVEVAVSEWHHSNGNSAPSDQQGSEDRLVVMKNITSHCLQLLSRVQVTVVPIFQELLEVDYLAHFIVALDELLQDKVLSWLKIPLTGFREKDEEILSMSFEVYLMFQDMAKVAKKIDLRVGSSLQLPSSHSWFVHLVPEWLRIALVRCKDGISRAVEFDGVVNSKKDVCFSSSLVETMTYLQQMVEFWKELNWPFPIDACGFMITLVKNISDAAMYYVEEVFARNRDSSECAKMSGGAADQLCLILNDMQHIQTTLSPPQLEGGGGASGGGDGVGSGGGVKVTSIFEDLQLEGFFSWIKTEKGLGQRARSQVRDTVESTVLAIQNKIHVATEKLAQQLPTVAKFVNKMLDAEESVSPEMALHPLADYLTANLQLLSSRLLYIVFWQLLRQLWSTVVTVLCNKTCSLASSSESHVGEGLSVAELESQQYKALLGDLELMCLSPPELVLKCCEDLVEQQAMATSLTEHRLGELALSIRYLRDKGTLEVTIVLAQNLPGLNKNGFSDPYVEIMLMPATYFEVVNRGVKTRVQRRNLNPVFNQTLSLPAREELLGKAGIILVLGVYDYDMIGENGLMGLCVLPCSDVPLVGVASGTQEGSEQPLGQPKSFLLPLFHVSESKVFQKLALRSEHSYHQEPLEFLKLLNKKCRPRSSPRLMSRLGAMTFTRHFS